MKEMVLSLVVLFILFLAPFKLKSQDTVRVIHTNYQSVFSKSKKYPVLVEWWVTKLKIDCKSPLKRKDNFRPDPLIKEETDLENDYKKSGFDRGHMMPAADNLCQTPQVQDECFYFSNMSPQYHALNAGDWKTVEVWTRDMSSKYDSVHVWCGNIGTLKKIGRVSVPEECWKVVFIKKTKEYFAFLFTNKNEKQNGIHSHEVPLKVISDLVGLNFN